MSTDRPKLSLHGATKVTFPTRDEFRTAAALCTSEEWQEFFDGWMEAAERRGYQRAVAALDSPAIIDVLIAHQRRDIKGCICGWERLGHSHPAHVLGEIVVVVQAAAQTPGDTDGH